MFKIATTMLLAGASATDELNFHANELFLISEAGVNMDDKLIEDKINIDINPKDIAPCQYVTQSAFFDLSGIKDGQKEVTDQTMTYEVAGSDQEGFIFNFCEKEIVGESLQDNCDGEGYAFMKDNGQCTVLKKNNQGAETFGSQLIDDDNNVIGLSLLFQGDKCPHDDTQDFYLNVTIMCDSNIDGNLTDAVVPDFSNTNICIPNVIYHHKDGCPLLSLSAFVRFIQKYRNYWGAGLIVLGIFLAFFGNKFVNLVLFLVGAFAAFAVLGSIFFNVFLSSVQKDYILWIVLVGIVLVACGVGYGLMKFRKYGVAIFAGWGGVMLGFVVCTTFIVRNKYAYWAIVAGCAIALFLVALKVEKTVIIMLTAFIGSYALVRGVSLYAGGFPSETELHKELESGIISWDNFPKEYYIYLGSIVALTVVSAIYQQKTNQKMEDSRAEMKKFLK